MMSEEMSEKALHGHFWRDTKDQYVIFSLAGEEYGIHILSVQEIIGVPHLTRLPNTPSFVKGVINLRGEIIPIIDLRSRFFFEEQELTRHNVIIVVQLKEDEYTKVIGLLVDMVEDVLSLTKEQMQDIPLFSSNIDSRFIEHIGMLEERLIIILDISHIFESDETKELERFLS